VLDRNVSRRGFTQIMRGIGVGMALACGLLLYFTPASAHVNFVGPLCGEGSAPDYGFTYDLQQAHWTVNWENYASEQAVTKVDEVLDALDADSIAQTMILIQPQAQVGNPVNCAVHFLRYMKLGLPEGERKDNGFVFLIVVGPDKIDVHYGVGLGLPALTAPELTNLNRAAEAAYQPAHNMDDALLTLVQGFDTLARSKYTPLIVPTPTEQTIDLPPLPSGPLGTLTLCGLLCAGFIFLMFLLWLLGRLARLGNAFNSSGPGSPWGTDFPDRWGRGNSSGGIGFPRGGGTGGSTRGGSGSGRSGRGN
jgi:hypothetical protein